MDVSEVQQDAFLLQLICGQSISAVKVCSEVIKKTKGKLLEGVSRDLIRDLKTIRQLMVGCDGDEEMKSAASDLLQHVCIPILDGLFEDGISSNIQEVAESTAVALKCNSVPDNVAEEVLKKIVYIIKECGTDSTHNTVSFLYQLFTHIEPQYLQFKIGCSQQLSAIFSLLLSCLCHSPLSTVHFIMSSILPLFISSSLSHLISDVWEMMKGVWSGRRLIDIHPLVFSLSLLCCFSDVFISPDTNSPFITAFHHSCNNECPLLDVRREAIFWEVVLAGLSSSDPLDRKRSMFLLHRVIMSVRGKEDEVVSEGEVFWWRRENEGTLIEVWDDLVLLLHTLEEKQVHIVKPVKNRMKTISAATTTVIKGHRLLHVMWLEVAMKRVFVHTEAKSIVKWGVCEALSLPLSSSPLLLPSHWQFIYGPLLSCLLDHKLYNRESPSEERPVVASLFTKFLEQFVSHLSSPDDGEFLHGLLLAIQSTNMSDVPLCHITHSLSLLPPARLLSPSSLNILRSMMSTLDTVTPIIRSAVMTFLLATAIHLSDLTQGIGWEEVASFMSAVNITKCVPFNSPTWNMVCQWIRDVNSHSSVSISSFLITRLSSLNPSSLPSSSLAFLLLQAIDTNLIPSSSLSEILQTLCSVLSSAISRPYLSSYSLTSALSLLSSLLSTFLSGSSLNSCIWEGSQSDTGCLLFKSLSPWLPEVIETLQNLMLRGFLDSAPSISHLNLLTSTLSSLHQFSSVYGFPWTANISPVYLMNFALRTLNSLLSSSDLKVVELTATVVGSLTTLGWLCEMNFDLPAVNLCSLPSGLSFTKSATSLVIEWGPLIDWCEGQYWTVIKYCLGHTHSSERAVAVWNMFNDILYSLPNHQLICSMDCLCLSLPYVEINQVMETVKWSWKCVKDCTAIIPSYLTVLLHPVLLFSSNPEINSLLHEVSDELLRLGEKRPGLANSLATTLCSVWSDQKKKEGVQSIINSLLTHKKLILQLCCFGGIGRRSMRFQDECERFVRLLGDQVATNCNINDSGQQEDSMVRLSVACFLVGVASYKQAAHFLFQLSIDIMEKISELSASKPRYFINSVTHREKQRLLQILCLLLPSLPPEGDSELCREVMKAMQNDNQTSVRLFLEWIAIVIISRQPDLVFSLLFPALQSKTEFRLSRLQSLFSVSAHLTKAWSDSQRLSYCKSLLPLIFPWTTSHHFVVRLYAQRTVERVWEEVVKEERGDPVLESCINFMRENSDSARFAHKLESNIGYSVLRPLDDLNIQTIYDYIPRLCGMVESDCISAECSRPFWDQIEEEEEEGEEEGGGKKVGLYCENEELKKRVEMMSDDERGKSGDNTRSISYHLMLEEKEEEDKIERGDVQKKITRWISGSAVLEELFPGLPLPREQGAYGGLIVVASLLTKTPNLGGLCRTCEIFGASQLVISDSSILSDPQFTALSVTAQNWLNITEVGLSRLSSYLLTMRQNGYRLVGAEQTAQSISISCYSFQPLTLLLLGNEREGIPVELLQMLDDCVEIPQLGVIRSLNVHVSGALLIWEYYKQHLLSQDL